MGTYLEKWKLLASNFFKLLMSESMLTKETIEILKKIKNTFMSISFLFEQVGIYSICVSSFIFQIVNFLPLTVFESWFSCLWYILQTNNTKLVQLLMIYCAHLEISIHKLQFVKSAILPYFHPVPYELLLWNLFSIIK